MTPSPRSLRHVEHVMGTAVSFDLRKGATRDALRSAVRFLHWVDDTFSVYKPASEVSRIGAGALDLDDASADVRAVMTTCDEVKATTDGWFDHRPAECGVESLDPSGYVKGWAIDRAVEILEDGGAHLGAVTAGGDIATFGVHPGGEWKVGIQHPARTDSVAAVVGVSSGAVATSGAYARGDHIWTDSRAGLASATVVGPELAIADALATAVYACGGHNLGWMRNWPDYGVLLIDDTLTFRAVGGVRLLERV